jgi:hypothetical protein
MPDRQANALQSQWHDRGHSRSPELVSLPLPGGRQQIYPAESTFWRRSLWEKAGGELNASYRHVGDFDLWVRFFRHATLDSGDALIGGYRSHGDAISSSNMERYNQRGDKIIESELKSVPRAAAVKIVSPRVERC